MGWMVPPTTWQLGRHFPLRDCSVFFPTTPPFPYVSGSPYLPPSLPFLCMSSSSQSVRVPLCHSSDPLRWKVFFLPALRPEWLVALMEMEGQVRRPQGLSCLRSCHFQFLLLGEGRIVCLAPWRPASWQHSPGGRSLPPPGSCSDPRRSCQEAPRRWALDWCPVLAAEPASSSHHPQITSILTNSTCTAASSATSH